MIEKIYSKIDSNKLLHIVNRFSDDNDRVNIVPEEHFLQCSILKMDEGKTFLPHKHVWKDGKEKVIAQESWVVIKGKVKCIFYDIDDTIISTPILYPGDSSFTLSGGHTYEILEDNTVIYEYKTGPYEGQELDKEFIND